MSTALDFVNFPDEWVSNDWIYYIQIRGRVNLTDSVAYTNGTGATQSYTIFKNWKAGTSQFYMWPSTKQYGSRYSPNTGTYDIVDVQGNASFRIRIKDVASLAVALGYARDLYPESTVNMAETNLQGYFIAYWVYCHLYINGVQRSDVEVGYESNYIYLMLPASTGWPSSEALYTYAEAEALQVTFDDTATVITTKDLTFQLARCSTNYVSGEVVASEPETITILPVTDYLFQSVSDCTITRGGEQIDISSIVSLVDGHIVLLYSELEEGDIITCNAHAQSHYVETPFLKVYQMTRREMIALMNKRVLTTPSGEELTFVDSAQYIIGVYDSFIPVQYDTNSAEVHWGQYGTGLTREQITSNCIELSTSPVSLPSPAGKVSNCVLHVKYCGEMNIQYDEIHGGSVYIKYFINPISGSCRAVLMVNGAEYAGIWGNVYRKLSLPSYVTNTGGLDIMIQSGVVDDWILDNPCEMRIVYEPSISALGSEAERALFMSQLEGAFV